MKVDLYRDPLGTDRQGKPVYLKDLWPTNKEIRDTVDSFVKPKMFRERYADVFSGDAGWKRIKSTGGLTYDWNAKSTYVKNPPYFDGLSQTPGTLSDVSGARCLALLGDSITTDHISPAGSIAKDGPAGNYLSGRKVGLADFNSYGARRGNHEVMMRGTFANIRIRNEMVPGVVGGVTIHVPSGKQMSVYDAAQQYAKTGTPLVVIGGKEYGTGSSRDWAAKGTVLLGVRAVITESFERIHRSNLIGMGVLPLQFQGNVSRKTLKLDGSETFDISGVAAGLKPRQELDCAITYKNAKKKRIKLLCRIDTLDEVEYFRHGGILHYVLRNIMAGVKAA